MTSSVHNRLHILIALAWIAQAPVLMADEPVMTPYSIDWSRAGESVVDMSGYLDEPAGKDGFIRVEGKHLARPDGARFRIWGVNVGALRAFPPKNQAVAIADDLARCGINAVRLHSIDSRWSPLFDRSRDDTQVLEAEALDRLDFFVAQLAERGVYSNLNLNVARPWKAGDS